jgi:hypothetical protein
MNLEDYFPNLSDSEYQITSPSSPTYNCIAWAAGDTTRWWWPDPMGLAYWPDEIPRDETLESFVALMRSLGFDDCGDAVLETGFEKIALFTKGEQATHAARQLESGLWTSKLGPLEDIEHSLEGLVGDCYGSVACLFRRRRDS